MVLPQDLPSEGFQCHPGRPSRIWLSPISHTCRKGGEEGEKFTLVQRNGDEEGPFKLPLKDK